jgi:hypothetical protein
MSEDMEFQDSDCVPVYIEPTEEVTKPERFISMAELVQMPRDTGRYSHV